MRHSLILSLLFFSLLIQTSHVWSQPETGDYEQLVGRWVRPDGGYVLVIKDVNSDGSIEASYFNPDPVNVSEAYVTDKTNIFFKLEGWGYEGSYYTLTYDKNTDRLVGIYHQLVSKQNYNIYFIRE